MIKPVYSHAGIDIYCGDCREILTQLPPVDIVLTDPPYGMDYQSNAVPKWRQKDKIHGDDSFPLWIFDILKPSIALMVWCRWNNLYELPPPQVFHCMGQGRLVNG